LSRIRGQETNIPDLVEVCTLVRVVECTPAQVVELTLVQMAECILVRVVVCIQVPVVDFTRDQVVVCTPDHQMNRIEATSHRGLYLSGFLRKKACKK